MRALVLALIIPVAIAGSPVLVAQAAGSQAPASAGNDRQLSELFYQLQILQQDVQELRGLVEEQAHRLNRLARDQQEQYIDLDRRVAAVTTGSSAAAVGGSAAAGGAAVAAGGRPLVNGVAAGASSSQPGVGSSVAGVAAFPGSTTGVGERDAYQRAFDLMKGRNFQESITAFNDLIVGYPNGQFTPNAFYWLGELHLAQQHTEQARQSFMQVVSLYPDHPKVPDTLYKLGVAYHRLGDTTRAMEYFNEVQSQFPQSSAAGLAASYAKEIR
ncbi:MAG: tol-pal system protein YbgF [Pseudomonadales bacterium]